MNHLAGITTPILTSGQLQKLKEHKYNVQGRSILEPLLQPLWRWVTELLPLWMAPNLVTITGLIINIVTSVLLFYYSPQARSSIPPSALVFCSIGLFTYQVLDAIDGKQARRTGSSSPLGELFDHGCDAVSIYHVVLAICCTLMMGANTAYLFFFFFNSVSIFYLAHWQSYVSGTLLFGRVDVTEVQIGGCLAFLISAYFGVQIWTTQVPLLGNLTMMQLGVILCALNSFYYYYWAFSLILAGGVGKNKSTVADTSVLSPGIPIGIVITCAFYVYKHSQSHILQTYPCLCLFMFGTAIAKLTCKLVVAGMSKHPLDMLDASMLGPMAFCTVNYFGIPVDEYYLLLVTLVFEVVSLSIYCVKVCLEISAHLNIYVFNITSKRRPEPEKTK